MFNISQQKINPNCPECGAKNQVTLKQVENQETIKCSECKKNIALIDEGGSTKKTVADTNKAIKNFDK